MPRKVKEPVQVYLDRADRDLLDKMSRKTGLPRTEVLRRGLRQLASVELSKGRGGSALERLIGALGEDASIPTDLSARHDDYLQEYRTQEMERKRPSPD